MHFDSVVTYYRFVAINSSFIIMYFAFVLIKNIIRVIQQVLCNKLNFAILMLVASKIKKYLKYFTSLISGLASIKEL